MQFLWFPIYGYPIINLFFATRHVFAYERTLLRARFDLHKDEPDFKRATQLLRLGEEEFWVNQHPDPVECENNAGTLPLNLKPNEGHIRP